VAREDCGTYQDAIYNNTTFLGVASSDEDSLVGVKSESTLRMKKANTYDQWGWTIIEGWQEFDRFSVPTQIWGICSQVNDGYPYLLCEYSASPCASAPGPGSGSSSSEAEQLSAPLIKLQAHITAASRGKAAQLIGKVAGKDILFAPNSVKLSSLAKRTLRQSARLAIASGSRVAVTGFAAQSSQGSAHEKSVAQRRALAVAKYLRAQGVKTDIYYFGLSGRASMAFAGEPRRVEIRTLKN
jgi:outer membrane protein OmpA-like peptidoglycan-associated protein